MKVAKAFVAVMLLFACDCCVFGTEGEYDITKYGAIADGKTLCTDAIQKAIDACSDNGGGVVCLPAGRFISGTIALRSGVTLNLLAGCTLLGSTDLKDYPPYVQAFRSYTDNYTDKSLIYAEKVEHIAITGRGVIDGQGATFEGPYKVRPYMIRIIECNDVTVQDVKIINSPMWVQHYLACEDVRIDGITVKSLVNHNNDGIDIDCCRRVTISNCNILSGDDAIVLKSTADPICRDVVVSNCVLSSRCNALKMGTESNGGFQNIVLSNCAIYDTRLAGVALEIVDGGIMDGVMVSNITMRNVGAPIFVRLGNRARPFKANMKKPTIGKLRNVTINNIEATGAGPTGCAISGLPGAFIENLTLNNLRLFFSGGGTKAEADREVPEKANSYPEYSMFGRLPAYGLYCRHVRGLKLVNLQLGADKNDSRHAVVFEDVESGTIEGLESTFTQGSRSILGFKNISNIIIRACRPPAGTDVFLQLEGPECKGIVLNSNDFAGVLNPVEYGEDVLKNKVILNSNHIK